jgi:alpha/beta superfamily hydrolase
MDSPVVSELAFACARAGLASLRFNWRGVGGSAGEPSGGAEEADADTRAALLHLAETVPGPLLACGYSFGAGSAVRVAASEPRVRGLLLVAPPPALLDVDALLAFPGRVLLVAGERDTLAPPRRLSALAAELRSGRFEAIPDADHFFGAGLGTLARLALAWLGGEAG